MGDVQQVAFMTGWREGGREGLGDLVGGIFMRAINQSFGDNVPYLSL